MMKKYTILTVLLALFVVRGLAQADLGGAVLVEKPLWNLNTYSGLLAEEEKTFFQVSEPPAWMHVSSAGHLIIGAGGKVKGIDPRGPKLAWNTKWTEDLPRINPNSFEEISNTPYFAIVDNKKKQSQYVMSTISGQVAANTGEDGINEIVSRHILPRAGKILYIGLRGNKSVVAMYDMNDPTKKWVVEKMFKLDKPVSPPLELNDKEFVIATKYKLYKVNSHTGEVIWQVKQVMGFGSAASGTSGGTTSTDDDFGFMEDKPSKCFGHVGKDFFYHQSEYGIMAYHMADGKQAWKKYGRSTEKSMVVFDPKGLMVFAEKVYLYDYDTGEMLWDKPVKAKGEVGFTAYTPQGLVVGIEKANARKVPYYELNCIDPDKGTFRFEDNFKVNGNLLEMWACDAGVFYTTDREINIWNAQSGQNAMESIEVTAKGNFFEIKSWDYSAPPNGSLLTAFHNEMAYIFNTESKHLYQVNTSTGEKKQVTPKPLVFSDGETASQIETRASGIFLSSSQNALLFDYNGHEQYRVELPKAKKGFLWKMVAAAALVYEHQRQSNDAIRRNNPNVSNGGVADRSAYAGQNAFGIPGARVTVDVEGARQLLHDRFEASKATQDACFIFTQLAEKAGGMLDGEYGLVKVNKDTGKLEKYLSFGKDIQPNFIVDEISGYLYYSSGGNYILCYDMN